MQKIFYLIIFFYLAFFSIGIAQDSISSKSNKKKNIKNISSAIQKSYDEKDDANIAKNYEDLALLYIEKEDYKKAEEYYKKAQTIYSKLKEKESYARVSRGLAKIQEEQGKNNEAIQNYDLAQQNSFNKEDIVLNKNDANRLRGYYSQNQQKSSYSNPNINVSKSKGDNNEIVDAYIQQAKENEQLQNPSEAIQSYNQALKFTPSEDNAQQAKIQNEIANVYLNTNQKDKAIQVKNDIISNSIKANDVNTQIQAQQSLANIYLQEKEEQKAIQLLEESYNKALESSNTVEAKKSLELLIKYYKSKGNYQKSIELYDHFLKQLEKLVKSDSSLMDTQLLEATEEKIKQLEKEKILQDQLIYNKNQLIEKQNTFNYFLIGGIVLIILFLILMINAFFSVKSKNKKIALQSLRREMNPHFIFNSLNSVNQFIAENKELEANKYLSSYSTLMRNVMENSNKDFISITNEIDLVKKYLDLEHLRFKEKFDYSIFVDEHIDAETTYVPNMIIQPQLENAVWHGLRYKNQKGNLKIKFELKNELIFVTIEDDGIGLTKSKELKTMNQKSHESRGLNNTKERIHLLNELYNKNIELSINEKTNSQGTIVEITFPVINKI